LIGDHFSMVHALRVSDQFIPRTSHQRVGGKPLSSASDFVIALAAVYRNSTDNLAQSKEPFGPSAKTRSKTASRIDRVNLARDSRWT
jgi:hypothetical protein